MKKLAYLPAPLCLSLLVSSSLVMANETANKHPSLLLAADTTNLGLHPPQTLQSHTFSDTHNPNQSADTLSSTLSKAHKAFKKVTSIRYGKKQKIKAKFGKSSYVLQYTHTL